MKKLILILLLFPLAFIAWAEGDTKKQKEENPKVVIIDVRTKREFDQGHLTNAINIPHTKIKVEIKKYAQDLNQQIILYCRSGGRSGIALKVLKQMGYKNAINAGSYKKLKKKEKDQGRH